DLMAFCFPTQEKRETPPAFGLVRQGKTTRCIVNAEKATLAGVVERNDGSFLVLLDETKTRVELRNETTHVIVIRSADRIVHACASTTSRHVACLTERGELIVYSCFEDAVVLRAS